VHVNTTLAQGLQILTASTTAKSDASTSQNPASDSVLKTANGISNQASNSTKQASATIGGALLSLSEKETENRSREALIQKALQKAREAGCSEGCMSFDSLDDMPEDMRAEAAKSWAYQNEQMAKLEKVAGTHNWASDVEESTKVLMRQMEEISISNWTYDDNGRSSLPKEELDKMSSFERSFVLNAGAKLKEAVAKLSEIATVTGDLIVKKDDGTYSFGKFEVRDKETGALYFNHDANGTVQFHDKGVVFSEFKTTGDHFERLDRKGYEQVFQQDLWSDV